MKTIVRLFLILLITCILLITDGIPFIVFILSNRHK